MVYVPKQVSTYIPTTRPATKYTSYPAEITQKPKPVKNEPPFAGYVPTHNGVIVEDTDEIKLTTVSDYQQRMTTKYPMGISVARKGTEGIMSVIIKAKTPLDPTPIEKKRYTTSVDNQQVVTIEVVFTAYAHHDHTFRSLRVKTSL